MASVESTLGANLGCEIGELQFRDRKEGGLKRLPFLLAVDFHAGLVISTLSVAKQVRYVCSFLPFLNSFDLHSESVEVRGRSAG